MMLAAARRVATPTGLATTRRALASIPDGKWPDPRLPDFIDFMEGRDGRGKQLTAAESAAKKEKQAYEEALMKRMELFGHEKRIRGEAPLPPTFKTESWVPEANVSPIAEENALIFRTKYYLQASGLQVAGHQTVKLAVKCRQLGLSEAELERLAAVAGPRFDPQHGVLKLVCGKHEQQHKNKAELRALLGRLLDDARENAEAHALIPQNRLPLHARRLPHVAPHGRVASHGPPLERPPPPPAKGKAAAAS